MNCLMHFAASSNGDNWFLGTDDVTNQDFVIRRGNPSSGGHETKSAVQVFLDKRPFGPERDALITMLAVRDDHNALDSRAQTRQ